MKIPTEPRRRALLGYNITLLVLSLGILLYYIAVRAMNLRLPCFFALITHLYCPGCGCTRALGALLRLDVAASLAYNPTALLVIGLIVYYEIAFLLAARGKTQRVSTAPLFVGCAVFVGYAVFRNILLVRFGIDPLGDLLMFWS